MNIDDAYTDRLMFLMLTETSPEVRKLRTVQEFERISSLYIHTRTYIARSVLKKLEVSNRAGAEGAAILEAR